MLEKHIIKRSIVIRGRKTSVSLEDEFWNCVKEIALLESKTLTQLTAEISSSRTHGNMSSAIRMYVLKHYREGVRNTAATGAGANMTPSSAHQKVLSREPSTKIV